MTSLKKVLRSMYWMMLALYPDPDRDRFRDEMLLTFKGAIDEQQSASGLLRIFLRELRDFPRAVFEEHWLQIRKWAKENRMAENDAYSRLPAWEKSVSEEENQPQPWQDAFLAGLPHLVFALLLILVTLFSFYSEGSPQRERWEVISLVFAWMCVGILIGFLVLAWRKSWPRWSASYYFYAFLAASALTLFLIQEQMGSLPYFAYILVFGLWVYRVTRKDILKGLLMIMPLAILSWFPLFEFMPNEIRNPLQLGMFLIAALIAIGIVRSGSWRAGTWAIIGSSMLIGIPVAYFRTYHNTIPPGYSGSSMSITSLSNLYAGALFWSTILMVTPLFAWFLWKLGQQSGVDGRSGYRMAFAGLLLNLIGNMGADFWYLSGTETGPYRVVERIFAGGIVLGAVVLILGIVKLLRAARTAGAIRSGRAVILYYVMAFGLPLMFMFPMFDRRRYAQTRLPFGLFYENGVPDVLTYGLGAVLLLAGTWLITRRRDGAMRA